MTRMTKINSRVSLESLFDWNNTIARIRVPVTANAALRPIRRVTTRWNRVPSFRARGLPRKSSLASDTCVLWICCEWLQDCRCSGERCVWRSLGMSRLFVGHIPFSQSEDDLKDWFEVHGFGVSRTEIIRDKTTGQSRGFGFVEVHDGLAART